MTKNKKLLTSGVAVAAAVGVLFGGTFAWQSISQTALNEVSASVNPGGRLHDDFNDITATSGKTVTINGVDMTTQTYDKNVYVENFTEYAANGVQVFARVRLDEYMELGANAGQLDADGNKAENNAAVSVVSGAKLDDKSTWTPYRFGDDSNLFHQYWNWELGGEAVTYMPTFNKNKDSLEADINGTFKGKNGKAFDDHVEYTEGATVTLNAIYDMDNAGVDDEGKQKQEVDEIVQAKLSASDFINADETTLATLKSRIAAVDEHIKVESEEHTAKTTGEGQIISMAEWLEMVETDGGYDQTEHGNYWVYDTDGWAYWAAPINPETATAPLLNGISRTETIINQDWYYGINVVAQFITYDDMGQDDNTGFYDITEGTYPSTDALTLLGNIGVDVPKHTVSSVEDLTTALAQGGIINVESDIELTAPLKATASSVLNLGEHTITAEQNIYNDSEPNGNWSLLSVQKAATVVINGGKFQARENDSYAVDVRDGSKVVINDGEFIGNVSAVYVKEGEAVINGGKFSIQQLCSDTSESKQYGYGETLNCWDTNWQNGTAKITVYGGSFQNFDPSKVTENTDVNGGKYLAEGCESNETEGVWTVRKSAPAAAGETA